MFTCQVAFTKYRLILVGRLIALVTIAFLSSIVHAQNSSSSINSSPVESRAQENRKGTVPEQPAQGEMPLSFTDGRLKPSTQKIRRLPPTSLPAQSNEMGKPQQIGVTRTLEPSLRLSTDSATFNVDGGKVYLLGVVSEGAKSIRVRFSQMKLPDGARIFVFPLGNKDEFYGPFGKNSPLADGTFWTPPVQGETIIIECFIPTDKEQKTRDYFQVSEVAHSFVGNGDSLLNVPLPCHNEVGPGYASLATAVGYLEFMLPDGVYICTGTLLNTSSVSFAPYLLTANHCFNTPASAQSLRVYWNYNTGDTPPPGTPFTDGAELLSTSPQSDFTFVRLTGNVPGGLTYSGWEGGNPAPNSLIVGIHHPAGSYKRISFGFSNAIGSSCSSNLPSACVNFIPVTWTSGTTEGGSSGSGLFYTVSNGGRLIGNLWGGEQGCNNPTKWYGRFSLTYYKIPSYIADAVCTYGISPGSNNLSSAGGNGSFNVTTNGSCYQSPVVTQPNTVQTFTNPAAINIADRPNPSSPPGLASFYPSTINISGFTGTVTRVRVILNGLTHTYPDDLDFLLVGPNGQSALLMSDAGGSSDINNTTLTIDQSGRTLLADNSILAPGTYRPSNYASLNIAESDGAETFPSPAPGRNIYDNSLEFFYGTNPNGAWRLYVVDDEAGDVGAINGGWNLELATTSASWLNVTSGIGYGNNTVNYSVAPNPPGQPARTGVITVAGQTHTVFQSAGTTALNRKPFDFDGDGKADISVFRPSDGVWYLLNSQTGFTASQFGISTDRIVPADYDGDGKTDIAVYRNGIWYLLRSTQGFTAFQFGIAEDKPVPADFDGDGKAELVVYRPSNGTWYVFNLVNNNSSSVQFGLPTDKPVVGDYDGDNRADYAVYRPASGVWYLLQSTAGFGAIQFGIAEDKPVVGDYDGDGRADEAVYRPSNGVWYLLRSNLGFTATQFGISTDLPAPADYDGDSRTDLGVYRNGVWYLLRSTQGFTGGLQFGLATDKPIPNAFIP